MTAIVAIAVDGKVWMGGDSAGSSGYSIYTYKNPKVFINNKFIIGYTTSFRMGQLLEYEFSPPDEIVGESDLKYMIKRVVPVIKSLFKSHDFDTENIGGNFIIGYNGNLFEIQRDYHIIELDKPYNACGCGEDLALGSLHSTEKYEKDPRVRIEMALDAASEFNSAVRKPYTILCD